MTASQTIRPSKRESIYLSGWEYNRLLQDDPVAPRNSALPAEILWNGAAQLWLFKQAYCSQEALDNEYYAFDELGWASGAIFADLQREKILVPCNWEAALDDGTKLLLRSRHREILGDDAKRDAVRTAIREDLAAGSTASLDVLKEHLLEPVSAALGCVQGLSPNSLRHWMTDPAPRPVAAAAQVLRALARPVAGTGITVCESPSESVSGAELRAQQLVEQKYERPEIPDLLAGDGRYAGEEGYRPYVDGLRPHRAAYAPLNDAMKAQWAQKRDNLLRLRDEAETRVWPFLHGEWLPELYDNPDSAPEFVRRIEAAVKHPKMKRYLDLPTIMVLGVAPASAATITQLFSDMAQAHATPAVAAGAISLASIAAHTMARRAERAVTMRPRADAQLALFYQHAHKRTAR